MALFGISDLHLSLGCDKPMDVFPGWKDYVARLEKNWRAMVSEEDTVVIGGDISWALKLEETEEELMKKDENGGNPTFKESFKIVFKDMLNKK